MKRNRKRIVGFVVDGRVPVMSECIRWRTVRPLFFGWSSGTAVDLMRFEWVAQWVNAKADEDVLYERYRPWQKYDLVVFLKSLNKKSLELFNTLISKGVKTLFDLNVDYLTIAEGTFYYPGMAPTAQQTKAARYIATNCDGIIADSQHLAGIAKNYNNQVACIPDNIRDDLIKNGSKWEYDSKKKLPLLWAGQHLKLVELLKIKDVLLQVSDKVKLFLVTNGKGAHPAWEKRWYNEFQALLACLDHEFIPFQSIERLMQFYDQGGVFISPRFLNNSYNLGHTEWKITLPMARGRVVLCSPQPSYVNVAAFSEKKGIRVCTNDTEWRQAFQEIWGGSFNWHHEQRGATNVVRNYYATGKIAKAHVRFLKAIMEPKSVS